MNFITVAEGMQDIKVFNKLTNKIDNLLIQIHLFQIIYLQIILS